MASSNPPLRVHEVLQLDFPKNLRAKVDLVKAINFDIRAELPAFDKGLTYSTTGLLNTKHKHDMYYAFESGGAPGLAHYLYKYADKRQSTPGNAEFKYFTDDRKARNPILPFLITTIHPDVVRALICGNLAYRYHNDSDFKKTIHRTITAITSPGIYFNQLFDCGIDLAAQTQKGSGSPASETEGKGFSYNDWQIISDDMDLYCNVRRPGSKDLAKALDYVFVSHQPREQPDHDKFPDQRRYFVSSRDGVLQEFLKAVDDNILRKGRKLDKKAKAEPAEWSVYEIGYSVDSLNRIKDHHGNKATNWIWGLVNAIIQHRFPDRFKIFSGQILYLCNDSHRNLGEALCSVLGSSYWDLMGCNPKRAGSIGSTPATAERGIQREHHFTLIQEWYPTSKLGSRIRTHAEHHRSDQKARKATSPSSNC